MREHRAQVRLAENVNVKMGHLLAGVGPVVGENPIARRGERKLARDRSDGAEETGDFGLARVQISASLAFCEKSSMDS